MLMIQTGDKSYWSWARFLSTVIGETVSKQAIFKRMNGPWIEMVKVLLAEVMSQHCLKEITQTLFSGFKNVFLHDSTTLHLPDIMMERFKGNVSKGKQKSVAKINVILNLMTGACQVMELMGFTVTEQALAESILSVAKAGDLVIRDLGYFVLPVFKKMDEANISFLSRLKYNTSLYDLNGNKINLLDLLKNKSWVDVELICGEKERLKVRLVAVKLPPAQAAERRRKAKNDRDKRMNHSDVYYALLDYVIFITNVGSKIWDYKQVAEAYRVRWNIEILFKSWKTGLKMEDMIPEDRTHTVRVESFIYLILLYITWFQLLIFIPFRWEVQRQYGKHLSIIKATRYAMDRFSEWLLEGISKQVLKELAYYCCYDKRCRPNAIEALERFYKPLG